MKKFILISICVMLLALYAIDEQHQRIDAEWGVWKELTLDGAKPEKPGTCIYCEYIKPFFQKYQKEKTKPVRKTQFEEIDSTLKDWPFPGANGNYIPSRDGLENSDTIVDGYPYNNV